MKYEKKKKKKEKNKANDNLNALQKVSFQMTNERVEKNN